MTLDANKKLIVFAEDWGRLPSSTQHIISSLLRLGWEIIWINSIGMREPQFTLFYFKRVLEKIRYFFQSKTRDSVIELPDNLVVINPFTIPLYSIKPIDVINRWILKRQLSSVLHAKDFSNALIWVSLPTAYPYLNLFINSPVIYYCCDDFSVFDGIDKNKIMELEKKLIQHAALNIVSNPVLAEKMPADKVCLLDHGVNLEFFQTNYPRPSDLPIGKPIAGFYGCLSSWIDVDLLFYCATTLKKINFVLIGPQEIDISQILKLENVFYLGYKSYQDIPAYSQHWDVSLLPFLKQQRTFASNPLTLKEYLSSGKPVVSISLPILKSFSDVVYIANTPSEFAHAIELAIDDTQEEKRKEFIKKYSWDVQVQHLEKRLLELFTHHEPDILG